MTNAVSQIWHLALTVLYSALSVLARVQVQRQGRGGMFASGLPYSRKLIGHSSCVNTLAFSSGGGRWLASAGDDLVVNLWDLHQEDVTTPSFSFSGHRSNVFTVAFSASNQYVFSGGTDRTILKYDMTRYTTNQLQGDGPTQTYTQHSDIIRSVSCHPYQDEVFLSAR